MQLLEGIKNQEKSKTPFDSWIEEKFPKAIDRKIYMERNYIPDVPFEMDNFEVFINKRKELINKKLKQVLMIK